MKILKIVILFYHHIFNELECNINNDLINTLSVIYESNLLFNQFDSSLGFIMSFNSQ